MRQRLGLTVSGAGASSLMKPVNLERSQTMLPFLSLMTPLSGSLAIRPRLAFAKSALSDHGSEAVEFLKNFTRGFLLGRADGLGNAPLVDVRDHSVTSCSRRRVVEVIHTADEKTARRAGTAE